MKLSDLKEANAELEKEPLEEPQAPDEEIETEAVEVEPEETEEVAETSDEEPGEAKTETWMEADDEEEDAGSAKFNDSDMAGVRKKYKHKLEKKEDAHNDKISDLEAKIARLEQSREPAVKGRPKRADFDDKDDPEGDYIEALTDWKISQNQASQSAKNASTEVKRQRDATQQVINEGVDQHYTRVEKLAKASNMSPDACRVADQNVREAINGVIDGGGDAVTEKLIASLGEGSETVFLNLGINKKRLSKLTSLLTEDRTGIKAAMYVGELKTELNAPRKKTTQARKPAKTATGDGTKLNGEAKSLKTAYDKAVKTGDAQARISTRRKAKQAGVSVSDW